VAQPILETMMQIARVLECDINNLLRFEALSVTDKVEEK